MSGVVGAMTLSCDLGYRGLLDGISGTWMRQMSYSVCRFWAYDEAKKYLGAGPDSPPWKLALAGVMGTPTVTSRQIRSELCCVQLDLLLESWAIQEVRHAERAHPS